MAYLAKKKIKGNEYYYLMESARIDGKPRHTKQIYLGSVDDVVEKLINASEPQSPLYSKDFELGNVAALYDIAKRHELVEMIDSVAGKRKQGFSTGQYLLAAMINRAIHPSSKTQLEKWYQQTILSKLMPVSDGMLSSQRFWDNTSRWTEDKIDEFETAFLNKLVSKYQLSPKCLIYDATNFFTYIDTENDKSSLARRGHSKEKRNDLRIVGLSLILTREDEIPLFYQVYDGSRNDAKQFASAVEILKQKYIKVFGETAEITLVFDRGNNSEDNIAALDETNGIFQYVGGLKKSQCDDLYQIPKLKYTNATNAMLKNISYYRTSKKVFGREMTVVITENPELEEGQLQGIYHNAERCMEKLSELSKGLAKWKNGERKSGKKPTPESIKKNIEKILSAEYMGKLFHIEIKESGGEIPDIVYVFSNEELEKLKENELGKTVLFTSHDDWDSEAVIITYRSAWKIEHSFRQMKDTNHLTVRPMWNWTDQKIRVHIFCCVMALRMCCILKKELKEKGIETSIDFMLECLGGKKQYIHYYRQKKGLKETYSLSKCNEETEKMIDALSLHQYEMIVR